MKKSKHFKISIVKSIIRIIGCILGFVFQNLTILCGFLLIAEIIGIFEEVYEKE